MFDPFWKKDSENPVEWFFLKSMTASLFPQRRYYRPQS